MVNARDGHITSASLGGRTVARFLPRLNCQYSCMRLPLAVVILSSRTMADGTPLMDFDLAQDIVNNGFMDGTFGSPSDVLSFLREWNLHKDPRFVQRLSALFRVS